MSVGTPITTALSAAAPTPAPQRQGRARRIATTDLEY
jgi:hypothetical protein